MVSRKYTDENNNLNVTNGLDETVDLKGVLTSPHLYEYTNRQANKAVSGSGGSAPSLITSCWDRM